MATSRMQTMANLLRNAQLVYAIDRLLAPPANTPEGRKGLLHVANMNFFELAFKVLTSYKAEDSELIGAIDKLCNVQTERMVKAYMDAVDGSPTVQTSFGRSVSASLWKAFPKARAVVHIPVLMSYAYYVHAANPTFSSTIPAVTAITNTGSKDAFVSYNCQNERIRISGPDYMAIYHHVTTGISAIKGWIGKPGIDTQHCHLLDKRNPDPKWNAGTTLCLKPSRWNRLLEVGIPTDQSFINHVLEKLKLDPQVMEGIHMHEWRDERGHLIVNEKHTSGQEVFDKLIAEIVTIAPNDTFSVEYGDMVKVSAGEPVKSSDEALHPRVHVEVIKGVFTASVSIPDVFDIIRNTEFESEMPAEWQKAKGTQQGFRAATVNDIGTCAAMAHAEAVKVTNAQAEAVAQYSTWANTRKKAKAAKDKLALIRVQLEALGEEDLIAALGSTDANAVKRMTKKLPK